MGKKVESYALSIEKSIKLNECKSKDEKKRIGQYFSSENLANQMVNMVILMEDTKIKVLDPGAGTGIMITGLVNRIIREDIGVDLDVHLYEIDESCVNELNNIMKECKKDMNENGNAFFYKIYNNDYLLCNDNVNQYDLVISNPPYYKLNKIHPYKEKFNQYLFGQGNIYFLFMIEAIKNLKEGGQFIFVTPRSFTSGVYFKRFRKYFIESLSITRFHLYESRSDIFTNEKVLQESLITKAIKSNLQQETILISSSKNTLEVTDSNEITAITKEIITTDEKDYAIRLPITNEDRLIINRFDNYKNSLSAMGFAVSTGPIVPFRHKPIMAPFDKELTIPILFMNNLNQSIIREPIKIEYGLLKENLNKSLYFAMQDMILMKRISNKEQINRLMISMLLKENLHYEYISFENHVNYIYYQNEGIDVNILNGIFKFLGSKDTDNYIRITNGTTQINVTELKKLPFPPIETLLLMGKEN